MSMSAQPWALGLSSGIQRKLGQPLKLGIMATQLEYCLHNWVFRDSLGVPLATVAITIKMNKGT